MLIHPRGRSQNTVMRPPYLTSKCEQLDFKPSDKIDFEYFQPKTLPC